VTGQAEGPGAALKSAREALGVSVREVSEALNLPLQVIEALEANDYERLRQPVFTRGYLRSYARLLELDPDAIAARHPQSLKVEAPVVSDMDTDGSFYARLSGIPPRVLAAAGGTLLILIIVLVVWLWSDEPESAETQQGAAGAVDELVVEQTPAAIVAEPDQGAGGETLELDIQTREQDDVFGAQTSQEIFVEDSGQPSNSEPDPVDDDSALTAASQSSAAGPAAGLPASTATDPAPAPPGVRRITPFGDDLLVLSFVDDCWVEVKDRDGNRLYGDLNRSGQTLQLIGRAPFQVLLGYSPGVEMTFNGEEIDVAASTRRNMANITVGS